MIRTRLDLRWDDGALCGRELVEVVQAAELARARLDGVTSLVQELADIADTPVDRLGPDGEQYMSTTTRVNDW